MPPKQEALHKPAAVASLAQGALFAEGTRLWRSQRELATNRSQSQPAACCLLFCPHRLSPPGETRLGFTSLHFTSLCPLETCLFVPSLLRNFGLAALTATTTHLLFKAVTQASHCPLLIAPIFLGRAHPSPPTSSGQLGLRITSLVLWRIFSLHPCAAGEGEEEDGRAASGPASSAPDGMVLERPGLVKLFKPTAAWQPGGHNGSAGGGMFPHA